MAWTQFWDMHSGGKQKLQWAQIFVELPQDEAVAWFESRFGRSPDHVTCSCCGADYSVNESPTVEEATAYHRGCAFIYPRGYPLDYAGRLAWKGQEPRWLDGDGVSGEPVPDGWEVRDYYGSRKWLPVSDYEKLPDMLVVRASSLSNPNAASAS